MKSKRTITVTCIVNAPPVDVEVEIDAKYPAFGVGKNPQYPQRGKWLIVHAPSGLLAADYEHKKTCLRVVAELSELGDWDRTYAELPTELIIAGGRHVLTTNLTINQS